MSSASRRAADYRVSGIETCFRDIEEATESTILHVCYTVNEVVEPTNVLIIYVTGNSSSRRDAVDAFRKLVQDRRLSEHEGLHHCGDSWIVVSNSIHWSAKYRFFLDFEDS